MDTSIPLVEDWMADIAKLPVRRDIWKGLIPADASIIMLAGATGIGKTLLAHQIALSLAAGVPLFGIPTQKTRTGYIGFEGNPRKMMERLEKNLEAFPPETKGSFYYDLQQPRRLCGHENEFFNWFVARDLGFVALDPVKMLVGGVDYVKSKPALEVITSLRALAESLELPILINHHLRKRDQRTVFHVGDIDSIKGATDYVDHSDTVMLLEREAQRQGCSGRYQPARFGYFTLAFAKARYAEELLEPITLRLNSDTLLFEQVSESDV